MLYRTSRDLSYVEEAQAISGADYISRQETVAMVENQTRVTVQVYVRGDSLPETEEHFLVNITSVR